MEMHLVMYYIPHLRLVCPKIDDKFGTTFGSGLSQNAVGSDT